MHLAEEVRKASRVVPRMMVTTILLNGAMGFVMVVTFCFCITDLMEMIVMSTSGKNTFNVTKLAVGHSCLILSQSSRTRMSSTPQPAVAPAQSPWSPSAPLSASAAT